VEAESTAPEPENARPRVLVKALVLDHQGREQHPQVPAHRGRRHADLRGKLARPPRSAAEQRHHLASHRITKRLDNGPRRHIHIVPHTINS
jgi:hypothetical protein